MLDDFFLFPKACIGSVQKAHVIYSMKSAHFQSSRTDHIVLLGKCNRTMRFTVDQVLQVSLGAEIQNGLIRNLYSYVSSKLPKKINRTIALEVATYNPESFSLKSDVKEDIGGNGLFCAFYSFVLREVVNCFLLLKRYKWLHQNSGKPFKQNI